MDGCDIVLCFILSTSTLLALWYAMLCPFEVPLWIVFPYKPESPYVPTTS